MSSAAGSSSTAAAGAADGVELNVPAFHRRATALLSNLAANPAHFGDAHAVAMATGADLEAFPYDKGPTLHTWLLGYEFSETVVVATRDGRIIILTSPKKAAMLTPLAAGGATPVTLLARAKDNNRLIELEDMIRNAAGSDNPVRVGHFPKDKQSGKHLNEFTAAMAAAGFVWCDATLGVSQCLGSKDAAELALVDKAAKVSAAVMKNHFFEEIMSIIDEEKTITHEELTDRIDAVLAEENIAKYAKRLRFPSDLDLPMTETCYVPIVQSGGEYDLRPSAQSNGKNLHPGTILCSLGVRYKSYCSNIARTLLINPTKRQEKNYDFLLEVFGYLVSLLRPGLKGKEVYGKVLQYVKAKRPDLEPNLVKSVGFGMGIEFRESTFVLNAKNDVELLPNAVLNVSIGFQNLTNPDAKDKRNQVYALHIADTVVVGNDKTVTLTSDCTRDAAEVCFELEDDEDDAATKAAAADKAAAKAAKAKAASAAAAASSDGPRGKRQASAILQSKTRNEATEASAEAKRRDHQKELAAARQEEGLQRFAAGGERTKDADKRLFRKFESYKKDTNVPRDAGLQIHVDDRAETILLPVYGLTVPFHISTIKNVSKSDEGDYVYLRLNFISPGQALGRKEELPFENPNATFIKTLTYRSNDAPRMNDIYRKVSELKKQSLKAEAERKDKADIVEQDRLVEAKRNKPVALMDVYARPTLDGKRLPGDLEIHTNGLRYRSRLKSENRIDILFNNIQHLFFQPCDNELIVVLHVHLKNPIMIGKKKTKDVQFYKEATDVSFDETGNRRRRAYGDEDELQQEQEEKRRRARLNKEFKEFGETIVENPDVQFRLDIPFRELGFHGVPFRANVLLQPTEDCLVHLTDPPFLIISLKDVEVVHLERVQFGLKNFDMVFVFHDFAKTPVHVNSIPVQDLELVRDWLDTSDILFTEGPVNLNWSAIMKTINDDPAAFFKDGGWSFLQADSDEDKSASEDSASEFEAESDTFMSDASSSDDSSDMSAVSESGSGSEDEDEEEYSSGEDWDEMEDRARRDDERKRKRIEEVGGAPPAKKRR
ncbi:FACT complex subunit spt16 [Allomyces javanicus]|nr:FACT complex subunit spt16 [Allomyces javanicus]